MPRDARGGLRLRTPTPECMLAMKCMAMRLQDSQDPHDIRHLAAHLGLDRPEAALDIVAAHYPDRQVTPKVQYGLIEIFEGMEADVAPDGAGGHAP